MFNNCGRGHHLMLSFTPPLFRRVFIHIPISVVLAHKTAACAHHAYHYEKEDEHEEAQEPRHRRGVMIDLWVIVVIGIVIVAIVVYEYNRSVKVEP